MRIGSTFALALTAAVALLVPSSASAQGLRLPDSAGFLVAGMADHAEQGGQQSVRGGTGGVGIGIKGGVLFSSFREARTDYKNSSGWQGTLFIGGNRAGALGLATELTYAKRGAKNGSEATDTYYLEVPLLIRENFGSDNKNTGAVIYVFAAGNDGIGFEVPLRLRAFIISSSSIRAFAVRELRDFFFTCGPSGLAQLVDVVNRPNLHNHNHNHKHLWREVKICQTC